MRTWLLAGLGLLIILASAGCTPTPGQRPALPTAAIGAVSTGNDLGTPVPRRIREGAAAAPTSTPAPWATALPPTPPAPPYPVEHSIEGVTDCRKCHWRGLASMPADHYRRRNETCLGCHQVAANGPAGIPGTPAALNASGADD